MNLWKLFEAATVSGASLTIFFSGDERLALLNPRLILGLGVVGVG